MLERAFETSDEQPGGYMGLDWEEAEAGDGLLTLAAQINDEGVGCSSLSVICC